MHLEEILNLCKDVNDVYIYDVDRDFLDCGLGCHTKYLKCKVVEIFLEDEHICVQIDY